MRAMKLTNKIVVVTGAGSGMGKEVALLALSRGASVAAVDVNERALQETVAKAGTGARIAAFPANITDRAAVEALPKLVVDRFGAVDGYVHCAGVIQPFVKLKDLDYAAIDRVFDINWRGTLYMAKSFLPSLLARPEAHIVNISSMGGFLPIPGQAAYGASKAAVKLFTEGLWAEMQGTKVHVTVVFPGAIATNIAANSGVSISPDLGTTAKPPPMLAADKAAREILDGMEADAYRVLVGSDARFLDRLYRLSPRRATSFIQKQMKALLPS
jgi:NAD(P)-dependent dehydrogenase (short-subunit alcohol dehydrogenase family)